MEIESIINDMKKNGLLSVKEPKRFSFGTFDNCKKIFEQIILSTDKTIRDFIWLPEYDEVIIWMTDTLGKGLALFGSNGRGKTLILQSVLPVLFQQKGFVLKPKVAINISYEDIDYLKYAPFVGLDDIGQEKEIIYYGNKIDVVETTISQCESYLKPLFLTSNLSEELLNERYGVHITDRINRLCKIVEFSGPSFRN